MAKKIRFNMLMNNEPVRDINDLRNHFNIDDALAWYKEGLLIRWLNVRGLEKEAKALESLNQKNDLELAVAILGIFFPDMSEEEKNIATAHLQFFQNRLQKLAEQGKKKMDQNEIIAAYHADYDDLVESMLRKPNDYALIKAALKRIYLQYCSLFKLDFRRFFFIFQKECPLGLFALLANSDLRNLNLLRTEDYKLLLDMAEIWLDEHGTESLQQQPYCSWGGETDGYWKDIEPKGKQFLLLRMEEGNFVRSAGKNGEELSAQNVNGKFPIVDGIDYKSNNQFHLLIYLEV